MLLKFAAIKTAAAGVHRKIARAAGVNLTQTRTVSSPHLRLLPHLHLFLHQTAQVRRWFVMKIQTMAHGAAASGHVAVLQEWEISVNKTPTVEILLHIPLPQHLLTQLHRHRHRHQHAEKDHILPAVQKAVITDRAHLDKDVSLQAAVVIADRNNLKST